MQLIRLLASFTNTYTPARETADFTNTRNTSPVKIVKTSSASAAVKAELKDNKMYSQDFSGAQFSVRVKDKNTGTWGTAKTYTTGSDGYVKFTEVASPKGYVLYDGSVSGKIIQGSDGKAVFSWITAGNGQVLVASDGTVTIGDPELTVVIDKVDSGTGRPVKGAKLEILEGSKSISLHIQLPWTLVI